MRRKNITSEMMKQFIAEALLLLMEKKQYDSITIGEITQRAGVNRSTYYRNFETKDEILQYYFEQIIYTHVARIPKQHVPLPDYLLEMFTHYYEYKEKLLLIHRAKKSHLILDTLNRTFSSIREDKALINKYEIYYHTGGIFNTFILWFDNEMQESPKAMTRISCSFMPTNFQPMLMLSKE